MGVPVKTSSGSADALHATVRRLKARTEALGERTRELESSSERLRAATSRLRAKTSRLEFDIEKRERSENPPPNAPSESQTFEVGEADEREASGADGEGDDDA
jgi:hypothetical protein